MSLRFSDVVVNDYFIHMNGITYQKIEASGRCCGENFNAIPIETEAGAKNQFFPEALIIANVVTQQ